jgi:acyl carrier protein
MEPRKQESKPVPSEAGILAYLKELAEEELELPEEQIDQIGLDTQIVEGLQLDSVSQVVLITCIEEKYGFLFDFEDREKIQTVRDLVEMILARTGQGESGCN